MREDIKISYIKFNGARKKEFQLVTTIEEVDGLKFAVKRAKTAESKGFLDSFMDKYNLLRKAGLSVNICEPKKIDEKIAFRYFDGVSLDSLLFKAVLDQDQKQIEDTFKDYKKMIDNMEVILTNPGKDFESIFGKFEGGKEKCLKTGCLDLILDNIFIENGEKYIIDYEWVFDFPLPVKYLSFRAIINAYFKYSFHNISKILPMNKIFELLEISKKEATIFLKYEYYFQKYVHNEITDFKDFQKNFKKLGYFDKYDYLEKELEEKNSLESTLILKEQEIKSLKEQSSQLSSLIEERDKTISEIKNTKIWRIRELIIKTKMKLGLTRGWK